MVQDVREGDRRHPKQKIVKGIKDKTTGELSHVGYVVALPRRSLLLAPKHERRAIHESE